MLARLANYRMLGKFDQHVLSRSVEISGAVCVESSSKLWHSTVTSEPMKMLLN